MSAYFICLLIALSLLSCQNQENNSWIKPQNRDITESVYASVRVIPKVTYQVQSVRSGIIKHVYVDEGAVVEKGQALFQIDPSIDVEAQLANATINLEEAKSNYLGQNNLLNNIQLEIQTTKDNLSLDSINLKRQERLLAQNIGKKVDYDQLKLKYTSTQKQLEILEQKLSQTKISLASNYKKALNTIRTEKQQLADFTILSKMDGRVYTINKEAGDLINAQEKFAEIGSIDQFEIEMDIDEVDITKIELGDSVLLILNAYPEEVFLAHISAIAPKKEEITQTFRVRSIFMEPPPKLYYGLAGEANIIVSKRSNTLVIPAAYLMGNNKVMTAQGEKTVKIGVKNLEFVEILAGIDTATNLIKPQE
ncbi:MAG: efflux RND transporter periplasmic adaptor subunit [Saprospiraceae bacterium]